MALPKARIMAIRKSDFKEVDSRITVMEFPDAFTISHYAYVGKATSATIPFTIEGVRSHVPYLEKEEFVVSVRQKVDLSASGPNDVLIKETGNDVGAYDYKNLVPSRPVDLPPGFQEVYRKT